MNHDITHCDNKTCKKNNKCYRFVAWRKLKEENAKLPDEQRTQFVSMLCKPEIYCENANYKFFMDL